MAPSSSGSGSGSAAPAEGAVLTVSATATTYAQADSWDQAVGRVGYLQDVSTDVSGSEGAITITTTAKVGASVTGTRAQQIKSQMGVAQSNPSSAGGN